MKDRFEGENAAHENDPQHNLLLAQIAAVHGFALKSDTEKRLGNFAGDQYFIHNATEIAAPAVGRLWLRPEAFKEVKHHVSELFIFPPEDRIFWNNGTPLFSFFTVLSTQGREYTYGVSGNEVCQFDEGVVPAARVVLNDSGYIEVVFNKVKRTNALSEGLDSELGQSTASEDYLEGVVGAISACLEDYRLFPQSIDRRIS